MTYEVQVTKTSTQIAMISVDASTLEEAVDKAHELAPTAYYSNETDPYYKVDFVNQLCPSDIHD